MIVLYSTGCPKCKVLKQKLDAKGVVYEMNTSVTDMAALGMKSAPALQVDGELMLFVDAVQWVNNLK